MFMLVITVFYSNELVFPLALKNILFQLSCFEQSFVQYKIKKKKREFKTSDHEIVSHGGRTSLMCVSEGKDEC